VIGSPVIGSPVIGSPVIGSPVIGSPVIGRTAGPQALPGRELALAELTPRQGEPDDRSPGII